MLSLGGTMYWDSTDFIVMGLLIFITGNIVILIARRINRKYWFTLTITSAFVFLWIWAELAVVIFTTWGS